MADGARYRRRHLQVSWPARSGLQVPMEGLIKGGHSHTDLLIWGSRAPLLRAREHTAWGGRHPNTEAG